MFLSYCFSPHSARDFSSDGIEFVNSDGVVEADDDDDDDDEDNEDEESPSDAKDKQSLSRSQRCEVQIMYIQMEFCEKSTLRY